jgi:hypothetical protein
MARALARDWPEYLMEALGLGLYMAAACLVTVAAQHPASPVRGAVGSSFLRRVLIGMAMGLTAVGLNLLAMGPALRRSPEPRRNAYVLPSSIIGIDTGASFAARTRGVDQCATLIASTSSSSARVPAAGAQRDFDIDHAN